MASHIVGYPRMGPKRELKFALESFWDVKGSAGDLQKVAADLRESIRKQMADTGIKYIPSNTFSSYDQMLDTTAMLGAVPPRYGWNGGENGFDVYFSMARGNASVPAMEMTKWFDTNYHFIVPELGPDVKFSYASHKAVTEYKEAKALGVDTVPVLVGPVSYLLLSKPAKGVEKSFFLLSLLGKILPIYKEAISELKEAGASWIQFDEPTLVMDLESHKLQAFTEAYSALEPTLFLQPWVAKKMGLKIIEHDIIRVRIANGSNLQTEGSCPEFKFVIQGGQFATQAHILQLDGYDVVLGIQWLRGLGTIEWDFMSLKIVIWHGDVIIPIIGMNNEESEVGRSPVFLQELRSVDPAIMGISTLAIIRSPSPSLMRVKIMVNSYEFIALIDTGSSHNFLQPWVAKKMGLKIIEHDILRVRIADGSILQSEGSCPEFKFGIQGCQFATQAHILQLDGYDVVLGIQWLRGLGTIGWDFMSLKMDIWHGEEIIPIIGMNNEESEVDRSPIFLQELRSVDPAIMGISTLAIIRSPSPSLMRVKIMVNGYEFIALIDTGSTHNFLQPWVAKKMGLKIIEHDILRVRIADGSILQSEGSCPEFKFGIQGCQFATQAHILQLDGYDVVLGIQWLRGLGTIGWDFMSLKMDIWHGEEIIPIIGMNNEESEVDRSPVFLQELRSVDPAIMGISTLAIIRSPSPSLMRVKIMVNGYEFIALIDTGSTHNFLQPWVAKKMGLKIIEHDILRVRIADGSILQSEGSCPEFKFGIQGCQFATQAHILQMDGYDVVLGIQWLRGLGMFEWNFMSLKMEIWHGEERIPIIGMNNEESEVDRSPIFLQELRSVDPAIMGIRAYPRTDTNKN